MRDVMPALVRDLPAGMNAKISYDKSIFIEESISAVYTTIAEAVVLVVIVIFFFLRTLRATIIPLVRSEEHTSELQSLMRISYAVFCLKKKKHNIPPHVRHLLSHRHTSYM